jgi:hypothetical protein
MPEPLSAHELPALAAEIAERIVRDASLADSLAGSFVCPPGKLCCFLGYNCDPPFGCARDFRCPHGFISQVSAF